MKYHVLPPNAGRTINSLRDSGYDFKTAVADIVDNSIAAHASVVRITAVCQSYSGDIIVSISDNGHGMGIDQLCNAMTYGSDVREDKHSLGKYGLGLKTASTSQCRRVSLISRNVPGGKASKLTLDIGHAEKTGKWEYIESEPTRNDMRYLKATAGEGTGTTVLWEDCDRLMGRSYKNPGGAAQQNALKRKVEELGFHLGIVFQRFIDHQYYDVPNVEVIVNGTSLKPFDPFALELGLTETVVDEVLYPQAKLNGDSEKGFHLVGRIIPARDELETSAKQNVVFPPRVNPDDMQGFYIYRENRLIHWGDWCGIYKTEFHYRLCRIELSFSSDLDEFFNVDFQKSKVTLEQGIASKLKEQILPGLRTKAGERYRSGSTNAETRAASSRHARSNKTISKLEHSEQGSLFKVSQLKDGTRRVTSAKQRSFIEVIPLESKVGQKVNIRPVDHLPEDALWRSGLFSDSGITRTYVEVNVSHPFYQRANAIAGGNSRMTRCLDYLIWSLAQAEYATKDQESLENYHDMITEVSRTLRLLAEDLPPVDE